jgi:hypothetical protein
VSDNLCDYLLFVCVWRYYEADKLAHLIFAELLEADFIPDTVHDVEIVSGWDWDSGIDFISFSLEISDKREMYVELAVHDGTMDILAWRMRDIGGAWEIDESLTLFDGDFFSLWGN